ncbi:hypothetical protein A359_07640 [secondary endosymbiont of Ctenarytaina eucalypti]|uniref:Uncharacterized protein n=1 Tax=secondary endosymbiont of Ctenarytaina eucalypti TaxID=1199245 RepID=J3YSC7_9ENTR|nr:hypothetical protein A359_07640 [secondary endosymbiont of Ctenarytaina eucalypti]
MDGWLKLPGARGDKIRILQIINTHLFLDENEILLEVKTFLIYISVLKAVQAENQHFGLVVITGGLAQDN